MMMSFDRNYKDSRILVTGCAGFIGSHLSERPLAAGAEVVCADNYFTVAEHRDRIALQRLDDEERDDPAVIGLHPRSMAQDDPRQRQPDLSNAKALLNWEPKAALADGWKETIAYFRRSLELS
jgi:nucleoside-diphosphate-sugar epimerase